MPETIETNENEVENEVIEKTTKTTSSLLQKNISKISDSEEEISKLLESGRLSDESIELIDSLHDFIENMKTYSKFRKEEVYVERMSKALGISSKEFRTASDIVNKEDL